MDLHRAAPRLAMFAITSLLLLGSAGCSDDGSDDGGSDATSTTAGQATASTDPTASTTGPAPSTTTAVSDITKADVQFRPVLTAARCNELAGRETDPGEDVLRETDDGESGDRACYLVGPAGGDGTDIEATRAISDDGIWVVMATVKESSRESINELFNSCYQAEPTCPSTGSKYGMVAIVVDGSVVSAPDVRSRDVADEAFTISVDYTEEEARALADVLNA